MVTVRREANALLYLRARYAEKRASHLKWYAAVSLFVAITLFIWFVYVPLFKDHAHSGEVPKDGSILTKGKPVKIEILVSDIARGYVYVQKGWTLSGIAKVLWKDPLAYKRLLPFNPDIIDPNLIRVGQKLWIRAKVPKVVLTKEEKLNAAQQAVWNRINKFWRFRHRKTIYVDSAGRVWAKEPLQEILDENIRTLDLKRIFKEVTRRMEWVDTLEIYRSLLAYSTTPEKLLLTAALTEQESNYRDQDGLDQEKGPMQIKPSTAWYVLKMINPLIKIEDCAEILEDININVFVGSTLIHEYLAKHKDNKMEALQEYNRGSRKVKYSAEIMTRYYKILDLYQKEIKSITEKKLKDSKLKDLDLFNDNSQDRNKS